MGIFIVQGATAGIIGTLSGVALGLLVAFNIDVIVPAIERALRRGLPAQQHLRHQPHAERAAGSDIVPVVVISLRAGLRGHAVPELARQPRQPGRGAAL